MFSCPFPKPGARAWAALLALMSCPLLISPSIASASVTSLSAGKGISLSPNPITSTGTISLLLPLSLTLPEPTQLLALTNTSTAANSGGLSARGHAFGLSGTGGAGGEGVLGRGATAGAFGVFGIGGGSFAGVAGDGGTTNGAGGIFTGGASGVTDQVNSGIGILAQGGAANPIHNDSTQGGIGLQVAGGNDARPPSGNQVGEGGAAIIAHGGNGTNGNLGGDGIDASAGTGPGSDVAGRFTGNVSVSQGSLSVEGTVSAGRLNSPLSFQTLTLENGWTGGPFGTADPAVAVDGQGIVHFRGAMAQGGTFNAVAFVLPAQFRPSHAVFVVADMASATTGRLEIDPNGTVQVQDTNSGMNAKEFTSLDGITYALFG